MKNTYGINIVTYIDMELSTKMIGIVSKMTSKTNHIHKLWIKVRTGEREGKCKKFATYTIGLNKTSVGIRFVFVWYEDKKNDMGNTK